MKSAWLPIGFQNCCNSESFIMQVWPKLVLTIHMKTAAVFLVKTHFISGRYCYNVLKGRDKKQNNV